MVVVSLTVVIVEIGVVVLAVGVFVVTEVAVVESLEDDIKDIYVFCTR